MIELSLYCGLRRNEVLYLQWDNINVDTEEIILDKTKSKKVRRVPVGSDLLNRLLALRSSHKYVFNRENKPRYTPNHISKKWKRLANRIGLKDVRFHDLRATCATWMLATGTDIYTVKEILGHSSIKITERYLGQTNLNTKKAANWIQFI